jgi:putative membrane protein
LVTVNSAFTPEEHRRIDAAIAAVEQRTSADLDLMVTRASDHYSRYSLVWAGAGALVMAGLAVLWRPHLDGRETIFIQLLFLAVLMPLFEWLPIRLWLVPARVKHVRARQLAHREFEAHFGHGESRRNRILFFVSLGERYVEIIADHETHSRIPAKVWSQVVGDFVAAGRAGRVADGLIAAIESCGALLQTHFPG